MPDEKTLEKARRDLREGKSPGTAAGEFVREEMHHLRDGTHGVSSPEQAIAIGLSKARRAGILPGEEKASRRAKKPDAPRRPTRTPPKKARPPTTSRGEAENGEQAAAAQERPRRRSAGAPKQAAPRRRARRRSARPPRARERTRARNAKARRGA